MISNEIERITEYNMAEIKIVYIHFFLKRWKKGNMKYFVGGESFIFNMSTYNLFSMIKLFAVKVIKRFMIAIKIPLSFSN